MRRPIVILTCIGSTVGGAIAVIEGCGLEVSGNHTTSEAGTNGSSSGTSGRTEPNPTDDGSVPDLDGGTDGADGTDGGDGGACPTRCDHCDADGGCVIDCLSRDACKSDVIACPAGRSCLVVCSGKTSCQDTSIVCPASSRCEVSCGGEQSCKGTRITPGVGGDACIRCLDSPSNDATCQDLLCPTINGKCELRCEDGGCSDVAGCTCTDNTCL